MADMDFDSLGTGQRSAGGRVRPERSALMTGRHEFKSGVTHTIFERERLALDAVTLADLLRAGGYRTGLFGKWHLGDERAYWPDRRGFDDWHPDLDSDVLLMTAREDGWIAIDHVSGQRLRLGPGGATACDLAPASLRHLDYGTAVYDGLWAALRSGFDQNNPGHDSPESVGFLAPYGNPSWGSASLDVAGFEPGAVHVFFQFNKVHRPYSMVVTTPATRSASSLLAAM